MTAPQKLKSSAGKGPAKMGRVYRIATYNHDPFVGVYIGVLIGAERGADTLVFWSFDNELHLVRYEHLDFAAPLLVMSYRKLRHGQRGRLPRFATLDDFVVDDDAYEYEDGSER